MFCVYLQLSSLYSFNFYNSSRKDPWSLGQLDIQCLLQPFLQKVFLLKVMAAHFPAWKGPGISCKFLLCHILICLWIESKKKSVREYLKNASSGVIDFLTTLFWILRKANLNGFICFRAVGELTLIVFSMISMLMKGVFLDEQQSRCSSKWNHVLENFVAFLVSKNNTLHFFVIT